MIFQVPVEKCGYKSVENLSALSYKNNKLKAIIKGRAKSIQFV